MTQSKASAPATKVALYEAVIATVPAVERKGAKMPYTSWGGHMFSFLDPKGVMGLRLPADALEAFCKTYKTKRSVQHGTVMQEYVAVPASLLAKTKTLAKHFAQSVAYVQSLKPKATKQKTATKKTATKKTATKKTAAKKTAAKKTAAKRRR